jgi:hypothetical protein
MSRLAIEIDNFVKAQVVNGNCKNEIEARRNIAGEIGAKEFLRSIEVSRQQYRDGEYEVVNEETNAKLFAELTEELLPKNS